MHTPLPLVYASAVHTTFSSKGQSPSTVKLFMDRDTFENIDLSVRFSPANQSQTVTILDIYFATLHNNPLDRNLSFLKLTIQLKQPDIYLAIYKPLSHFNIKSILSSWNSKLLKNKLFLNTINR